MAEQEQAPHGSWRSPVSSDLIAAETVRLGGTAFDGDTIYWTEQRPKEGGRTVVVRRTMDGRTLDINPSPFNARTRVHEYGGRPYTALNDAVYFSNFDDQRLYRCVPGSQPLPITPEAQLRYGDCIIDPRRNQLFCVREDHRGEGEAVNTIVSIQCDGDPDGGRILVSGGDFYSSPRLSPGGTHLAWLTWNHPNMPFDETELWVGEVQADGSLGRTERVAGGSQESVFQPEWSPDGVLHFISDRTGWWNLYRLESGHIEALYPMEAEFGVPLWKIGMSTYAFESQRRIICAYAQRGQFHLARLDTATLELEEIPTPYTAIADVCAAPGQALFTGGSPTEPNSVVSLDLAGGRTQALRRANAVQIDPGYISIPREIEFPTEDGQKAYGFYYPPCNRDYVAPDTDKPPLLVVSHGGPTGATTSTFSLSIQYWTSRGIAVLDVNYGGSTGYGRAYRQRLNGKWGVVDVDDCVNGARYLVECGEVDGDRLQIRGGSAGGYTTLAALIFRDVFKAGASHFGVSDLETLARDTHKFESRYLDNLIGPYPARKDLYVARSPIHFTHRLFCPLILFQGLEDRVVPPDQAQKMFAAARAKGLPTAYVTFEDEGHGFRRAENIKRALDAELFFYSKIFGFELADPVEAVRIYNL